MRYHELYSVVIWKEVVKNEGVYPTYKRLKELIKKIKNSKYPIEHYKKYYDTDGITPFCVIYKKECQGCPLYWKDAKEERGSDYRNGDFPCAREYYIWKANPNRETARKFLEKIEDVVK